MSRLIFISAFNFHLTCLKHALCIPVVYVCHVYFNALFVLYALTLPVSGLSFISIKICSVPWVMQLVFL